MKTTNTTRALIEGSMLIALATVLSIFKIVDMPYGGSVTIASMLPIIVFAYRHGIGWGIGGGLVYAAVQQLLGMKDLFWFTTWQSIVAVIFLDYIIAFMLLGFGGIFRSRIKSQRLALSLGSLVVSIGRFICHVISGCTVWAGLSIPDTLTLVYSLGYNATYMIPETIVLVAAAYYLGSVIDFSRPVPERMIQKDGEREDGATIFSGMMVLLAVLINVWLIAPKLQNPEDGSFMLSGLSEVNWIAVAVVTVLTVALSLGSYFVSRKKKD